MIDSKRSKRGKLRSYYIIFTLCISLLNPNEFLTLVVIADNALDGCTGPISDPVPELLLWEKDIQGCLAFNHFLSGVSVFPEFIELLVRVRYCWR